MQPLPAWSPCLHVRSATTSRSRPRCAKTFGRRSSTRRGWRTRSSTSPSMRATPWPRTAAAAAVAAGARGRETVLVVEDDAAVRNVAVGTLEGLGYLVRQAGDGREALQILQLTDAIDLLFTDLVMPNGISGQDLLRIAR